MNLGKKLAKVKILYKTVLVKLERMLSFLKLTKPILDVQVLKNPQGNLSQQKIILLTSFNSVIYLRINGSRVKQREYYEVFPNVLNKDFLLIEIWNVLGRKKKYEVSLEASTQISFKTIPYLKSSLQSVSLMNEELLMKKNDLAYQKNNLVQSKSKLQSIKNNLILTHKNLINGEIELPST